MFCQEAIHVWVDTESYSISVNKGRFQPARGGAVILSVRDVARNRRNEVCEREGGSGASTRACAQRRSRPLFTTRTRMKMRYPAAKLTRGSISNADARKWAICVGAKSSAQIERLTCQRGVRETVVRQFALSAVATTSAPRRRRARRAIFSEALSRSRERRHRNAHQCRKTACSGADADFVGEKLC